MEFKREIVIEKNVTDVWEVLGTQYSQAYQWASGLYHSEGFGAPKLAGASCNNRTCETSQGVIKEEIRVFDPQNYNLVYEVIEGFPFFVDQGINNWKLTALSNGKTKVDMHLTITTKGFMGKLMGPMMKLQMNKIVESVLDDLKQYIETGQPSARKAKEMAKRQKQAA
jgi:hypothetical protein